MVQSQVKRELSSFHRVQELNFQAEVLNSIGEAVIATDMSGQVLYWNRQAENIYGWTQGEVIGRNILDLSVSEENLERAQEIMTSLRQGQVWAGEFKVRHKEGRTFLAHVTDTCLRDPSGEPAVIIGVSYDLTALKALELQKEALQEEIHQQAIAMAAVEKDRSEVESRFKSEFIAHMSHEIRTPLSAIKGYAQLLSSHTEGQQNQLWAQTIIRASQQLEELVNDVLDLSKIGAGQLKLEKEPVSLAELISELMSLFELKAGEKGLEFTTNCDESVPAWVHTDPRRLKQVLINLIGNAFKFTDKGFIKVSIASEKSATSSETKDLLIRVQDSGIGILLEEQLSIFEAFYQAPHRKQREQSGAGLGLSLSRSLARQLGGELELLQSAPGEGSTFLLRIPLSDGALTAVPPALSVTPLPDTPLITLVAESEPAHPKRILVVEDSADIRALMEFVLKAHHAEVTTATDGERCLEAVHTQTFDLITMDLDMPVMDGYTALERLRAEGYQMAIVAVSAKVLPGERERCLELGFTDYLTKPINFPKLLSLAI